MPTKNVFGAPEGAGGAQEAQPATTDQAPEMATTETEAQAPPEGGHPGEGQQPKKYAGRYESVEDLEKGYLELRKLLSRQGAQEVVDAVAGTQKQAQPQADQLPQQPVDWNAVNESFKQAFEANPLGTLQQLVQYMALQYVQPLQEAIATQTLRAEAMRLAVQYPDFGSLAPRVASLMAEKPYLKQLVLQNPEALESVYLMARSSLAAEAVEAAKEAGREEGAQVAGAKAQGQGLPSGARREPKKPTLEEQIKEAILGSGGEPQGIFG